MKSILILSIILTMIGCASKRMAKENQTNQTDTVSKYTGKVMESEGCGFIVLTKIDNVEVSLYVVNLSEEFKKANTKVQFDFIDSRAMMPENCKASKVVVAENMTLIK